MAPQQVRACCARCKREAARTARVWAAMTSRSTLRPSDVETREPAAELDASPASAAPACVAEMASPAPARLLARDEASARTPSSCGGAADAERSYDTLCLVALTPQPYAARSPDFNFDCAADVDLSSPPLFAGTAAEQCDAAEPRAAEPPCKGAAHAARSAVLRGCR
jgi:hypothetical protein